MNESDMPPPRQRWGRQNNNKIQRIFADVVLPILQYRAAEVKVVEFAALDEVRGYW